MEAKLQHIEWNTSQAPNVVVQNVLPSSEVKRARIRITGYEAVTLAPDKKVRMNIRYANRGDADAVEVYVVWRMRFIEAGKTVAAVKASEEGIFKEIRAEMAATTDKITSSLVADSPERWFTVEGPVLASDDFQVVEGEQEISRNGSPLIVAVIMRYRDQNASYEMEICGYLIKPKAFMNCIGGHNLEQ